MASNSVNSDGCSDSEWAECNSSVAFKAGEKKKRLRKSIKFQTWTYFFLLAVLSIFVLWLFEIIFFKSAYKRMKKQEVERLGSEIAGRYPGFDNDDDYTAASSNVKNTI